jgi:hypothetical protein
MSGDGAVSSVRRVRNPNLLLASYSHKVLDSKGLKELAEENPSLSAINPL